MFESGKFIIIAELANAHGKQLDVCLKALEGAHGAGADALKLATYKPGDLTVQSQLPEYSLRDTIWSQFGDFYGLYEKIYMPWDFHGPLFARGKELGISVFSTPFSVDAIEFLEPFNPPAYKIASFEIVDEELVAKAASTGKPIIISTGQANYDDIDRTLEISEREGAAGIYLLHCISKYPAKIEDMNFASLLKLKARYGDRVHIGLSDHTLSVEAPLLAMALGAQMLEKHITVSKAPTFDNGIPNPDVDFSLTPEEYKLLVSACRAFEVKLGTQTYDGFADAVDRVAAFLAKYPEYSPLVKGNPADLIKAEGGDVYTRTEEDFTKSFRRSLIITNDLKPGDVLHYGENYKALRPGHGLHPKYRSQVEGKAVRKPVAVGEALNMESIG